MIKDKNKLLKIISEDYQSIEEDREARKEKIK